MTDDELERLAYIRNHGACRERPEGYTPKEWTALWFEPGEANRYSPMARAICERCPVRSECWEWASNPPREHYGMWGGGAASSIGRIRHGSPAGYRQHLRHGEAPCAACREAMSAYNRVVRARKKPA